MIVVDTNLIALAVLPGEREALAILASERDPDWIAPALWRFELSNFLVTAMRVRGLPLALAVGSFEAAERLVVDADLALLGAAHDERAVRREGVCARVVTLDDEESQLAFAQRFPGLHRPRVHVRSSP